MYIAIISISVSESQRDVRIVCFSCHFPLTGARVLKDSTKIWRLLGSCSALNLMATSCVLEIIAVMVRL
jgi:hypothetical protein